MKTSGLVMLIEPERLCYPYVESIKSFLPVVDEMVCVMSPLHPEDGREQVKALGDKIRIVQAPFDLDSWGWISYGIVRTTGYHACEGDVVLMFDADGVLHEKDQDKLKAEVNEFNDRPEMPIGYWLKFRFYQPTRFWYQNKHSGIYNKRVLGDRFDFYRGSRGAPNFSMLKEGEQKARQFSVRLFGYEHMWDTREVIREKVLRYGKMIDRGTGQPVKTDEEYWDNYIGQLKQNLQDKGHSMPISEQPAIIQDKLKGVNDNHFGHNFFDN